MKFKDINPGEILVDIAAAAVKKIRNRPKAVARRAAKKAAKEAAGGEFLTDDEVPMDAVVGAFKSKLVWLGFMQVVYGIFQLWATGDLSPETAGPVVSGALTIVLRAITTGSLAEKAK
jgi:hypothetical protein